MFYKLTLKLNLGFPAFIDEWEERFRTGKIDA
jgi:hypothetical protein